MYIEYKNNMKTLYTLYTLCMLASLSYSYTCLQQHKEPVPVSIERSSIIDVQSMSVACVVSKFDPCYRGGLYAVSSHSYDGNNVLSNTGTYVSRIRRCMLESSNKSMCISEYLYGNNYTASVTVYSILAVSSYMGSLPDIPYICNTSNDINYSLMYLKVNISQRSYLYSDIYSRCISEGCICDNTYSDSLYTSVYVRCKTIDSVSRIRSIVGSMVKDRNGTYHASDMRDKAIDLVDLFSEYTHSSTYISGDTLSAAYRHTYVSFIVYICMFVYMLFIP